MNRKISTSWIIICSDYRYDCKPCNKDVHIYQVIPTWYSPDYTSLTPISSHDNLEGCHP